MNLFLAHIGDANYSRLLPDKLNRSTEGNERVKIMAFPPLGIQTLAPVLRQRGHGVRLFDTCHPQMKAQHIAQEAQRQRPHAIGLSFVSTTSYPATKEAARLLKSAAPETPIIIGGAFATVNADRILRDCRCINAVCVGEGEELLPDYLDHLDDPGSVAGLVWRRGDEVIRNSPRPLLHDLDNYPYPDRTSLPIDYIESLPLDVPAVLSLDKFCTMQTSRGCPYHCIYCDIPLLSEGKWRSRSPEHVLGEMQQINDLGYRSVYLTDDHFLIDRKRISAICDGIVNRKLEFRWGCEGRADAVAVDQLPAMKRANCEALAFGVEAGTQKILDRLRKHQTLEQVERAVSEAKRQGIRWLHGFFILGCPDETADDIRASFRFAARLQLDTFGFNRLCAYRGTPLWQEYVDRGIIDDDRDWQKWFKCSDIDPTALPGEEVNRLRMQGYAWLFARRSISRPIRTFQLIRSFGRHMETRDLIKLLRSPFHRRRLTRTPDLPAKMLDQGLKAPIRGTGASRNDPGRNGGKGSRGNAALRGSDRGRQDKKIAT
jgi:radical SAM superfamily enzyme YgiQ (UPF0313 family)